jgi:O-methyltransferase
VATKTASRAQRTGADNIVSIVWKLAYELVTLPILVVSLFYNRRIDPAYRMTWFRRFALAARMQRNALRIPAATSFKAHLAMAVTLLEIPPSTEGVVVECGCFRGGSTTNLSLICGIVGRTLVVYDSFEGLPPAEAGEHFDFEHSAGMFDAGIDTVRRNVTRYGDIDACEFRQGWFKDTMPDHTDPVVLCFLDVDYQASLHDCVRGLWPHLVDDGYLFIDEYTSSDFYSLFFSEQYWRTYFDRRPPGLLGAGTGIPLGQYLVVPFPFQPPLQTASSVAYTRKDFFAHWSFYPDGAGEGDDDGPGSIGRSGQGGADRAPRRSRP